MDDMRIAVVVPVRVDDTAKDVLNSPGLKEIRAQILLCRDRKSAADAFSQGVDQTSAPWIIYCHQDVYFPEGSGRAIRNILSTIPESEAHRTILGFAGMEGDLNSNATPAGLVLDRPSPHQVRLDWPESRSAISIDEFAVIMHRDCKYKIDPKLGWHLWATDLCLQAFFDGTRAHILRVLLHHVSLSGLHLPPPTFHDSGRILARKYSQLKVIHTLCGDVRPMPLSTHVRAVAKRILGPKAISYVRRCFRRTVPELNVYRAFLEGKRGLEIGGPSGILGDEGSLPVYGVLETLDNCLFSARTIWTGDVQEGGNFQYHPLKRPGNQIVCESTDLKPIKDSAYECVLASHCLEHMANPLRALAEWRRVLQQNGLLLLILPHKDGTFDWRRPTTGVAHMIEDLENKVGEDDLTHLPEILALHDLEKDKPAGSKEEFQQRCAQNYSNRALHHHVFDTWTAVALVDHAALQVVRVDTAKPYHIIILAQQCDRIRDNSAFLGPQADYRRRSPFPSDRVKP